MELLKWISYGTWQGIPIMPNDLGFVQVLTWIFFVFVGLKLVFILMMDTSNIKDNPYAYPFIIIARVTQIFIYLLLYSIIGLFHNPDLYYIVFVFIMYFIGMGISHIANEFSSRYVWKINEKIKERCEKEGRQIRDNVRRRSECKRINKKIYDYRKTAIIG